MTDRWDSIQRVVLAALELDPVLRDSFVRETCGGDGEMIDEVLSLLAQDEATSLLDGALSDVWMRSTRNFVGRELRNYEVVEKLASGGMGVVYKARDKKLGRIVALKFLRPGLASDSDARARLLREARTASSLDHPNICTVFEVGETTDDVFIAMAFYDGITVEKMLSAGMLDHPTAIDIVAQVGQGLSHAHAAGIIHRDIKPANLLVTESGLVKIVDFGIARPESATNTSTGTVGTLAYMSPEQLEGVPSDPRTDIWSLGVVFFEMVSGRRPFDGENPAELIRSILNDEPDWPAVPVEPLSHETALVLQAMLRKDRERRYQHVDDVLNDLKALPKDGVHAKKLRASKLNVSKRSKRLAAGLVGSILISLAAVTTILFWRPAGEINGLQPAASTLAAPGIVAVFPFSEGATAAGAVGDRLAREMSRQLFDAAVVTSLDYNTVRARAGGKAVLDPAVALVLTQEMDGRQFILGSVDRSGDALDVNASLYDGDGRLVTQMAAAVADTSKISHLVDELLHHLLSQWEPKPSADHIRGRHSIARAASATASGAALKQFVLAFYSGDYALEEERLTRALEIDSTFAMAAFARVRERMGNNVTATKQDAGRALPLLLRYRHKLPEVEAGLTEIYAQNLTFEEKRRKYVDLLDHHQHDGALWEEYGEFLFLNGYKNGWRTVDARGPLVRARDLTGFQRFLLRDIGLLQGDLSLVSAQLEYDRSTSAPEGRYAAWYESALEDAAVRSDLPKFAALLDDYRRFHPYRLSAAADRIAQYGKDVDYPRQIARLFMTAPDLTPNWREWGWYIDAQMDVASGRLHSGTQKLLDLSADNPAWLMHSLLARFGDHVPDDPAVWSELDRRVARWDTLAADWPFTAPNPHLGSQEAQRSLLHAMIAFRQEDWTTFAEHLDFLSGRAEVNGESSTPAAMMNTLRAWRMWKDGRLDEALALLDRAQREYDPPDFAYQSWITDQLLDRYLRAKILYAQGDYENALTWYLSLNDRGRGCFYSVWAIGPVFYLSGDIYEKLGRPGLAAMHYRKLIDFWSDADNELQHYVDSARVRVERLDGVVG